MSEALRVEEARFQFGQWTVVLRPDGYEIFNLAPDGSWRRYYRIYNGQYGEPLIEVDPDLAFAVPIVEGIGFVDAKGQPTTPNQRIGGIICQPPGPRFSLTNAKNQQDVVIGPHPNGSGSILVGGEEWWLATLFLKDSRRFKGYDAFLVRERRDVVRVIELGDLELF